MADKEPTTRKAYREAQRQAQTEAQDRDHQRQTVERDYARQQKRQKAPLGRFDEVTYKKVNSLKKKLNWAIGIVTALLVIVALVLFLV
ncbi:MAG: hypothetical protein LKJ69_04175 [Lactobacillus sp.]|jgi:Flp pilus assembly protein TadB|nr:hypothetical protein [Lactobacillus sp.]MCI2032578.1 hypothetical protein [Lactobacillus sp.]